MAPATTTTIAATKGSQAKRQGTKRVAQKKPQGEPAPKRGKVCHPFCNAMLLRYLLLRR
jgi:hypothetical protein